MGTVIQDLRYALRLFARHPGLTAVAVLSLALATGPNSALFGVINGLFFRRLPVESPDRLVAVHTIDASLTYPDFLDIQKQCAAFSDTLAWLRTAMPLSVEGYQEVFPANAVSANYFSALGVRAAAGRLLLPERDEKLREDPPAVISYSVWQRRFGGRPDAVGKTLRFADRSLVIVGVAPRNFRGMDFHMPSDIWVPFSALESLSRRSQQDFQRRDRGWFEVILGRLRPGATLDQARVELDVIGRRLADSYPATNKDRKFGAYSYAKDRATKGLVLGGAALGLVSLVLLVACANVAGLMLSLAETRRREVAVRLSMGAGRWRLIRQFLTESVLLSLTGAAVGLLFGLWLMRLPVKPPVPISLDYGIRLDARVFAYTLLLSFITAVLFGLVPALQSSKADLVSALKAERGKRPRRAFSARNILVVGQFAISQFLLAGTALWVRSYINVQDIHPGFDLNRKLLFASLAPARTSGAPLAPARYQELIERLRALPGVIEASAAGSIPLSGSGTGMTQKVVLPGAPEPVAVRNNFVGPRYFAAMGTRLLRGRDFEARETAGGSRTVVLNETLARRLVPDGDAVDRWIRIEGVDRQVIGVVEDGKYHMLRDPAEPYLYLPSWPGILVIQTAGDPGGVAEVVRRTVTEVTPQLYVANFSTLKQNMRFATYFDTVAVGLIGSLGLLGIFLAAVGLYGVVAHAVNRRTHEIGIRLALGAQRNSILRMVLRQGVTLALIGVPLGLAAAVAGAILVSNLLFGVTPADPVSYLAGALLVIAIALLACHLPARRATRIDPAVALRYE